MHQLLRVMHQAGGSDLFISADFPPSMKSHGSMKPLSQQKLNGDVTKMLALSLMNDKQKLDFETEMECNYAISLQHNPPPLSNGLRIIKTMRMLGWELWHTLLMIRRKAAQILHR